MKNKLVSILAECEKNNVPIKPFSIRNGLIGYEVDGFSSSGFAKIYIQNNKIICETKNNTFDEIEDFKDLCFVSFEWYLKSKELKNFEQPPTYWAEFWVKIGLIKKEIKTIYKL